MNINITQSILSMASLPVHEEKLKLGEYYSGQCISEEV